MFKRFWWVFVTGLVLGPMVGLFVGGVIAYVTPKKYESSVALQVRPPVRGVQVDAVNMAPYDHTTFITAELKVIGSQAILDPVIDQLDLSSRWSAPREEAMSRLRQAVEVTQIKGTDLIEIKVETSHPNDSKIIAEAVADTYRSRRSLEEHERMDRSIKALRNALRDQEEVVEEKRKLLTEMIRNEALDDSPSASRKLAELESEIIRLKTQINTLLTQDTGSILTWSSGTVLPNETLKTHYPKWLEARRQLEASWLAGLGEDHPTVKQQLAAAEKAQKDVEDGIASLRETLQAQLATVKKQAERLRKEAARKDDEVVNNTISPLSFESIRADFEVNQALLEKLKVKLISEEMQGDISEDPVVVHADPVEATAPSSPNIALHLVLGAGGGLLLGILAPFALIPMLHSMSKPRTA